MSGNKEQMNGRPNFFPIPRISSRPALLGIELVLCILASVCNSLALPLTSAAWGAGRRRGSTSSRILSQEEKERAEVMSSRYLGGTASQSRDSCQPPGPYNTFCASTAASSYCSFCRSWRAHVVVGCLRYLHHDGKFRYGRYIVAPPKYLRE